MLPWFRRSVAKEKWDQLSSSGFAAEVKAMSSFSSWLFAIQIMVYLIGIESTIFCAHLGKVELDAVTLANSISDWCVTGACWLCLLWSVYYAPDGLSVKSSALNRSWCTLLQIINILGIHVGSGLSFACDTLISQAYGGNNLKEMGFILQRGILIVALFCFPCWAFFLNTERILFICGQGAEVSRIAGLYVMIFMPALPAIFLYQLLSKYLQNQGIVTPLLVSGIMANILNVIGNAIFLHVLNMGVVGSACAVVISYYAQFLLLLLMILWKKLHVSSWGGWSVECLLEWGFFCRLALCSMLMLCFKWWAMEAGTLLTGLLGLEDLGAHSILYQYHTTLLLFATALSSAVTVRVGNALGAANIENAKMSNKVGLFCSVVYGLVVAILSASLQYQMGYLYTKDTAIMAIFIQNMPVFALSQLLGSVARVMSGALRAVGKQGLGAIVNGIGYCILGLPLGAVLMFSAKLGVLGLSIAWLITAVFQVLLFLIIMARLDWNKAKDEAESRVGLKQKLPVDAGTGNILMYTHSVASTVLPTTNEDALTGTVKGVPEVLLTKELILQCVSALAASIGILAIGVLIKIFTNV